MLFAVVLLLFLLLLLLFMVVAVFGGVTIIIIHLFLESTTQAGDLIKQYLASLVVQLIKQSACNTEDLGLMPGWEDPLERGMATHSSILPWRIPWTV